jgi:protein-S-isoprenylcysteine O-methyltransferase Ste14
MRGAFLYAVRTIGRWAAISTAISALLFLMAGTTQLTSLRAYLASFSLVMLVTMLAVDPQLARERSQPGPDSSTSHLRAVSGFFFLLTLISASFLVGRTHTLVVPTAFRWIALAIFTCGSSLQTWAMIANPFFSPVVRIQADRGHKLIDSGPYRLMRHPGYFAMCISVPAAAVAIGSWLALVPAAAFIVVIYERAKFEERFLNSNLPGYAQYAKTVPSGLFCFRRT